MIRAARPSDQDAIVAVTRAAFRGEEKALRIADEAGEPVVLLLGHPSYYPRFGFEPATPLGILAPGEFGDAWMAAKLGAYDPACRGQVVPAGVRVGGSHRRSFVTASAPECEIPCSGAISGPYLSGGSHRYETVTNDVRGNADHLPMEATLQVLAWVGLVCAASVAAALAFGVLFGS